MKSISIKATLLAIGIMTVSLPVMATGGKGTTWGFRHMSFTGSPHETSHGINLGTINAIPPGAPPRTNANGSGLQKKSIHVGCGSSAGTASYTRCNPYKGDTSCSAKRPILCVKTSASYKKRPPYVVTSAAAAMPKEFYSGWVGYPIKLTAPKFGTQLTSPQAADQLCGNGWVMAEHHMGKWISGMDANNHANGNWNTSSAKSGGWGFHAKLNNFNANKKNLLKNKRFWVKINNQPANCWNP